MDGDAERPGESPQGGLGSAAGDGAEGTGSVFLDQFDRFAGTINTTPADFLLVPGDVLAEVEPSDSEYYPGAGSSRALYEQSRGEQSKSPLDIKIELLEGSISEIAGWIMTNFPNAQLPLSQLQAELRSLVMERSSNGD